MEGTGKVADPTVKKIARKFLEEVERILKDKVVAVVAFGSRVWGDFREDSDYDLLVLHRGDQKEVEEVVAEVALKLSAELGVGIEPIVASIFEFRGDDRHLYRRCKSEGLILYPDGGEAEARRREAIDLLFLAEEFLEIARALLKLKMYRGVIDDGYNAAELAVKALLLWDGHKIPGTHGGVVGKFGEVYVLKGRVSAELGKRLSLSLEKRNKARYDARADIKEEDAKFVLQTAEEIIKFVKSRIRTREE